MVRGEVKEYFRIRESVGPGGSNRKILKKYRSNSQKLPLLVLIIIYES